MTVVRYQVMPPLASDEYQELFEDIKINGVLEPIHVDEDGVVIDGHHRSQIASELGIVCPVITHDNLDDAGKRSLAFTLNLKRRHLNREQRRSLIAESLKADPQLSNREHSKRTGAHKNTVDSVRDDLESNGQIAHYAPGERQEASGRTARGAAASQPKREPVPEPESSPYVGPGERIPESPRITTADLDELNTPPADEPKPRQGAITDQFTSAVVDLNRILNKFHRISENQNFPRNKEKVAALHRHDLNRAISELQNLADQLN